MIKGSRAIVLVPHPQGRLWTRIQEYYHLPVPYRESERLSYAMLPPGWRESGNVIYDHLGGKVMTYSWGAWGALSWSYIYIDEKRLKELGIVAEKQ